MITFKKFLEDSRGPHGEYVNDVAEKTMIHAIINQLMRGVKDDNNYDEAYSFIEDPLSKNFYDKYYPAFEEKAENGKAKRTHKDASSLSPETIKLLDEFKKELPELYKKWKSK